MMRGSESVALLYVLVLSRKAQHEVGRYQSAWVNGDEAEAFIRRFGLFLQADGRHEFWIFCPNHFQLIYDRHERIWIYGDLDSIVQQVREAGIPELPIEPIPAPHTHHYHAEFDPDEEAVMSYWEWTRTPLRDSDGV
jgi:hypothetical protein